MTPITTRRGRAAEACRLRFHGKPYSPGVRDCPKMVLHVLHRLNVAVPFASGLKWKNEAEGLKALKGLGFSSLIDAVDSLGLTRIAPAQCLAADIAALATDHKVGCLAVYLGNGNWLAFTDASPNAEVLTHVTEFAKDKNGDPIAWRVI